MAERAGGLPQETLGLAQNFFWRGSLVGRSDPQVRRTPPIQVNRSALVSNMAYPRVGTC
jgi:hypothetical protein